MNTERSDNRLEQQMLFLMEVDKLKGIIRQSPVLNEMRKENDAEHSWHFALMAFVLLEYSPVKNLDLLRIIKMILIHDIVEVDAGDTFVYDLAAHSDKREREERAADRIFNLLPHDQAVEMRELWEEFEEHETPESRYANAIDRLHPMMLNYTSGGRGWAEHKINSRQVLDRNKAIEDGSPELWQYARECVRKAVAEGFLPE